MENKTPIDLNKFQFERVLGNNQFKKTIFILGSFKEDPPGTKAILKLMKTEF
jgi:hypothetical protein